MLLDRSPRKTESKKKESDVEPQNGDDIGAVSSLHSATSSGSEKVKLIEHEIAKGELASLVLSPVYTAIS